MQKKIFITSLFVLLFSFFVLMENVEAKSFKVSVPKNYKSGGILKYQNGYFKPSTGKYVQGHLKTSPDNYKWNNRKNLYGF